MTSQQNVWTVIKLLQWSAKYLQKKGITEPRLNAERLLAHVLKLDRVNLYLKFDRPLTKPELAAFKKLLLRRAAREPLQYILGETEFFSISFKIHPGVLIPRPETETLVEQAIAKGSSFEKPVHILDVGTGSGIIAITLALHLPGAQIDALDISEKALQTARENATFHKVAEKISFLKIDVFAKDAKNNFKHPFHLMVSNPPYIAPGEQQFLPPEVRDFEPPEALFAKDPLQYYKVLLQLSEYWLVPGGYLMLEIAPHRAESVRRLFEAAGVTEIILKPDLSGKTRIIIGRIPLKKKEKNSD